MYIDIGQDYTISSRLIVSVLDIEQTTTVDSVMWQVVKKADDEGRLEYIGSDLPRSILITFDRRIYLSPISSKTIAKRIKTSEVKDFNWGSLV